MFRHFFRDKVFFRQFVRIMLPMAGQNLIMVGISMADTIMVGNLGEIQLSAVALGNQFGFILNLMLFGLCGGSNVLIAQYWGKRDIVSIHKVMAIMYRVLFGASVIFTVLSVFCPRQVMMVFSNVPEVISAGADYLRVVGWGYAVHCFAAATLMILRSVGTVRIALVIYLTALASNVLFNWIFIFGNLGAPAMGVVGAALSTVISRFVEIVIVVFYMARYEQKILFDIRMVFAKKLGVLRSFMKNAMPILINELLWGVGASALAIIIGWMGTEFTAANSVCSVLGQLVSVAIAGAGAASAVIIGNTVGAGKYKLARIRAAKLMLLSTGIGIIAMGLIFLLRTPMLSFYNISDQAKAYASQLMNIHAFVVLLSSFSMVAIVGVLRGGGDGRFAAYVDVLSLWLVAIPLGFLSGHVWGWAIPAVYAMLKIDELVKVVLTMPRLLSGKWVNDITRENVPSRKTAQDAQ